MIWLNAVIQGILVGGFYALFAAGLSLLFGVMGVINLAHGDLAVIAAYAAIGLAPALHLPMIWSFVVVVPLFAAGGYLLQRTLLQAALDRSTFTTLLATFGLSVIIENVLLEVYSSNGHTLNIGSLIAKSFNPTTVISISYVDVGILAVAVLVLSLLQTYLSRTSTGRLIRAVADDREAAELVGANSRHVFGVAAALAFATLALAGIASGILSEFNPTAGPANLLFAFEAVVIGGIGSLWGTLAGGIALGIAQQVGAQINPQYQILAGNVLFLAVLAFRSQGLFQAREAV